MRIALVSTHKRAGEKFTANGDADMRVIRAVIGGMTDTGFWDEIAARFKKATGIRSEVVVTGPKHVIAPVYRRGEADLVTMHASDTIINIVADGWASIRNRGRETTCCSSGRRRSRGTFAARPIPSERCEDHRFGVQSARPPKLGANKSSRFAGRGFRWN